MPEATMNYVWVSRDKPEESKLLLPGQKEKPHTGTILSAGELVKDSKIKRGKGKKALFHKGVGQELEYNGQTFLILIDQQIIGVD